MRISLSIDVRDCIGCEVCVPIVTKACCEWWTAKALIDLAT